jgi:hypothetical protein
MKSVTLTRTGFDPIDRLMEVTAGSVLRVGHNVTGGEYDGYYDGAVSTKAMRRLAGAGLVSRDGLPADVLQHVAASRFPTCSSMTADEFVTWYVSECLAGLDVRNGSSDTVADCDPDESDDMPYDHGFTDDEYRESLAVAVEPLELITVAVVPGEPLPTAMVRTVADTGGPLPEWVATWLGRLEFAPKVALLTALAQHRYNSAPAPTVPATEWAEKLVGKFNRRAG